MKKTQKTIKYLAISFAVFLIISIISSIVNIFINIFDFNIQNNNETKNENVNEIINSLEIELKNSKLSFVSSNKFEVVANENTTIKEYNKKLVIKDKKFLFNNNDNEIIIYVPKDKVFDEVSIEAGGSNINIENLLTKEFDLEIGAGKMIADNLNVSSNADIDTGAGTFKIKSGIINNLELDMGVGEVTIAGTLTGDCDIDAGIGNLTLSLDENINYYSFDINKGLGNIYLNNEEIDNHYKTTTGNNKIIVDGGIGNIKINTISLY